MPTTPANLTAAWQKRAPWLAQWAMLRLVNRSDIWIRYLSEKKRSTDSEGKTYLARQAPLPAKRGKLRLNERILAKHFRGESPGDLIGVHTTSGDNTAKWIAICMESHEPVVDKEANLKAAHHWEKSLHGLGFHPVLLDTDGQGGYLILVLFRTALPASLAHDFAAMIVSDYANLGLSAPPRVLPHGSAFDENDWLRIPGRHPTKNVWPRAWKLRRWIEGADTTEVLLHAHGDPVALVHKLKIPSSELRPALSVTTAPPKSTPTVPAEAGEAKSPTSTKKKRAPDRDKIESQILSYLLASTRGEYELGTFATIDAMGVTEDHFASLSNRQIYWAMRKLHEREERITPTCIGEEIPAEDRMAALAVIDRLILQKHPTADEFEELLAELSKSSTSHADQITALPHAAPSILALPDETPQTAAANGDPDLRCLIQVWPMLSPTVRQELLAIAMVKPADAPPAP